MTKLAQKPEASKPSSRWTPRRRGKIYCSPACGGAKGYCTFAAYEKAMADSLALIAELGTGWRANVWENLGWHYSATSPCGRITVHGNQDGFTAFLGPDSRACGQWAESAKSAKKAIVAVLGSARGSLVWLSAPFDLAEDLVSIGGEQSPHSP